MIEETKSNRNKLVRLPETDDWRERERENVCVCARAPARARMCVCARASACVWVGVGGMCAHVWRFVSLRHTTSANSL